jgi:hypothetical protein
VTPAMSDPAWEVQQYAVRCGFFQERFEIDRDDTPNVRPDYSDYAIVRNGVSSSQE